MIAAGSPNIQGWTQIAELGAAFALSMVIGVEREIHQKSAGLRTHTLVGVGAALFMLISKYGFNDVARPGRITRPIASGAQIVRVWVSSAPVSSSFVATRCEDSRPRPRCG